MSASASRRTFITGAGAVAVAALGAGSAAAAPPEHSQGAGAGKGVTGRGSMPDHAQRPASAAGKVPPELAPPLEFAYFRTWHDRAVDPARPNSFADVPPEIDVVFVFPDYTPDDSPFWDTLRDEYVPDLHAQGTRVVRTVDIGVILDPAVPETPEGYRAHAEHLVATLVDACGLDGLDVDMERTLSEAETARASGVFRELARLIGPLSGTGKLFIYDTNRDGFVPLFRQTADCLDFVLVQSYGRSLSSLQGTWDSFAGQIDPAQYLIGFSFYEERSTNLWGDAEEPFETSRAAAYADWQPAGVTKGGIFSYAVDRDGVVEGDDEIRRTDYSWSIRLKERMLAGS
ncbi:endo-beta-N-acetylglucosaminidase family protein [Brachybacterium hainanense]|uniref:endo-beta-N-acetylglucosaminidase family protein n=1 Tax=Brachybacterium hainanense TaxID=1541174 RepID=UPI00406BD13F